LEAGRPAIMPVCGLANLPDLGTSMSEDQTKETSKQVRDSVKDAIGKITGKPEIRNEGAAAKSLGEEGTADVKDQPGQVSKPR
jgi:uncharacterized protein YjbJ (UPF0337 family)